MPNLNGITTLGEMTKLNLLRKIPVIMISGRMTSIGNLKTAFDAGAIDFIRKPIEPEELIAR
jgi:DNA-binding response OmpR family regulator